MCEILFLAFDTFASDPGQDAFAYKMGHVIDVKPDGHPWGSAEGLPKFWKIFLSGISVDDVKDFLATKYDYSNPMDPVATAIRKWRLDVNGIPAPVRNALDHTGIYNVTGNKLAVIQSWMNLV
jgi:hypothetical protein